MTSANDTKWERKAEKRAVFVILLLSAYIWFKSRAFSFFFVLFHLQNNWCAKLRGAECAAFPFWKGQKEGNNGLIQVPCRQAAPPAGADIEKTIPKKKQKKRENVDRPIHYSAARNTFSSDAARPGWTRRPVFREDENNLANSHRPCARSERRRFNAAEERRDFLEGFRRLKFIARSTRERCAPLQHSEHLAA